MEFKTCQVLGSEIRVWGAASGRGLAGEVVSAVRAIVRRVKPESPIALMADHHPAEFGVVGAVVASASAITPDLIGGDCGCGVLATRIGLDIEDTDHEKFRSLYEAIRSRIPVGSAQNRVVQPNIDGLPLWDELYRPQKVLTQKAH